MLQSTWSYNLNGMYQVAPDRPWGFNVAGNVYGREGYPLAYFVRFVSPTGGVARDAQAVRELDDVRVDDILTVDLRLDKEFQASGDFGLTLSLDVFNVLNEAFVLERDPALNGTRPNFLNETLSPRVWRLGVRLNWR